MSDSTRPASPIRAMTVTAGAAILVMAVAAGFSYGTVLSPLLSSGLADVSLAGVAAVRASFGAGLFGWLVILLCDVLAAWALYECLKPASSALAALAALLRLVYVVFLAVAVAHLAEIAKMLYSPDSLGIPAATLDAQVRWSLSAFSSAWSVGLVVFGAHLAVLGGATLAFRAIPKIIGILLLVAAAGYLYVHGAYTFFPSWDAFTAAAEKALMLPMSLGELVLAVWLLVRGRKLG